MEKKHLSFTGAGPAYVATISVITVGGLVLNYFKILPVFQIPGLRIPKIILSVFFIILAVYLWIQGALKSEILKYVEENRLAKDGVYAYVRNPIYSAFMFLMWGLLLLPSNLTLILLIPILHILMAVFLIPTEEKWLHDLYGIEYEEYCKKVNRAIPWFPEK